MSNNHSNSDSTMTTNTTSSTSLSNNSTKASPPGKRKPEAFSALYNLAARNLREYHGVPSMTAGKLEKTLALLDLPPRRVVAQALAPRNLLMGKSSPSLLLAAVNLAKGKGGLDETAPFAPEGKIGDYSMMTSGSDDGEEEKEEEEEEEEDEEEGLDDKLSSKGADSNSDYDSFDGNNNSDDSDIYGSDDDDTDFNAVISKSRMEAPEARGSSNRKKARRPIHAALVAGGINLRPRETRPLLRALGVSPRRLVRLGLVERKVVRGMPGKGKARSNPYQHLRGPPRPFHGAGHPTMRLGGEEGERESMPAVLFGPHFGPGHGGGLGRLGGRVQGPLPPRRMLGRRGAPPPAGHVRGRSGRRAHGHHHHHHHQHHPHHGPGQQHDGGSCSDSSAERHEGKRLRMGSPWPEEQHGPPPRVHGGGGAGGPHGRPHGPPHGPPPEPFHQGAGVGKFLREVSPGPEQQSAPSPNHGGVVVRPRSRPHGPPHEPMHGLPPGPFHEKDADVGPPPHHEGGVGGPQGPPRGVPHGPPPGPFHKRGAGVGPYGGGMAHPRHGGGRKRSGDRRSRGNGGDGGRFCGGCGGEYWQHNRRMAAHPTPFYHRDEPGLEAF